MPPNLSSVQSQPKIPRCTNGPGVASFDHETKEDQEIDSSC